LRPITWGKFIANLVPHSIYIPISQVVDYSLPLNRYNTGGCAGRNELGITNKPVVEECAAACDALSTCVSFEYKRSSTVCQLSSTCDRFDLTLNEVGNSYHWYLKVNDEVAISENPTPYAYLWLLDDLNGREVTSPAGVTSTNYYIGYNTGGCVGRNELLVTTKPLVEE